MSGLFWHFLHFCCYSIKLAWHTYKAMNGYTQPALRSNIQTTNGVTQSSHWFWPSLQPPHFLMSLTLLSTATTASRMADIRNKGTYDIRIRRFNTTNTKDHHWTRITSSTSHPYNLYTQDPPLCHLPHLILGEIATFQEVSPLKVCTYVYHIPAKSPAHRNFLHFNILIIPLSADIQNRGRKYSFRP